MRTKRLLAIAAIVAIAAAFLAGYVPQRQRRATAEMQLQVLQDKVASAEGQVRTGQLLGRVLTVKEQTMRQNYGQAQELSSAFFNAVQVEAAATPTAELRDGLNEVLAKRDAVTAALAKGDAGVIEILHSIELRLRRALGYTLPPEPAPR